MKRVIKLLFAFFCAAFCLVGCHWANNITGNLMIINQTDIPVGAVGLSWENETVVGCNADGSPIGRGEYLAFAADRYPVTVTLYRDGEAKEKIVSCIVGEPPVGRWDLFLTLDENGAPQLFGVHCGEEQEW